MASTIDSEVTRLVLERRDPCGLCSGTGYTVGTPALGGQLLAEIYLKPGFPQTWDRPDALRSFAYMLIAFAVEREDKLIQLVAEQTQALAKESPEERRDFK